MDEKQLARKRYREKMRECGRPVTTTPEEFRKVVWVLSKAREHGMSTREIAEVTGVSATVAVKVLCGQRKSLRLDTYQKIMANLRPVDLPAGRKGTYVDPTGTIRRAQALKADGFPSPLLGERLGVDKGVINSLARDGYPVVYSSTRKKFADLYCELENLTPADLGVDARRQGMVRAFAAKQGFAPRRCWTDWTIDDPDAIPDWTGHCGTGLGMKVHRREGIPVCRPCKEAYAPGDPYPGFDGEKLRKLRERAGLSREEVGRRAGLDGSTVQYWENGRSKPYRGDLLDRVLSVLDATYEDVCDLGRGQ